MIIAVVCSDPAHPIMPHLEAWCETARSLGHQVSLSQRAADLPGADIAFLISCSEIITPEIRTRFGACLVIHASDLPEGRGWSPLVWQVLEGRNRIAVTLLEAADPVDTGAIWAKESLNFKGTEIFEEINAALFAAELKLMDFAIANIGSVTPEPQRGNISKPYRRRNGDDSRIDPHRTIAEQFDLLRIADTKRYPAYFEFRGERYLELKKHV